MLYFQRLKEEIILYFVLILLEIIGFSLNTYLTLHLIFIYVLKLELSIAPFLFVDANSLLWIVF